MAQPRIVRAGDLVRVPWKDGGGTTAEVAVHPPGTGFDGFAWRISLADVAADGPFSRFPGVDRTLVLVEGRDLTLTVDGDLHRLAEPGDALAFPGEAAVASRLGAGAIRDLNVMTRRGRATQRVARFPAGLTVARSREARAGAEVTAVVALVDGAAVTVDGQRSRLDRLDVALCDEASADLVVEGDVLVIGLAAVAA